VYGATTSTPSEEDLKSFKVQTTDYISASRDPNTSKELHSPIGYYRPFFNIDKKQIKNMYDELGLTETLFPITRSCDNPKVKTGHCNGKCWWCEERKWAFGTYE
jgi:7-cyano-7-deazaguanine synthase in queuosine biosynthesis